MQDHNKIYKQFNKEDNFWDRLIFYTIYQKDNKKFLRTRGWTFRYDANRSFDEWGYYLPLHKSNMIDEELNKLLEWNDITYGIYQYKKEKNLPDDLILESIPGSWDDNDRFIVEYGDPADAFRAANKMVLGEDGKGSKFLDLCKVRRDTPCGNYFGVGIL